MVGGVQKAHRIVLAVDVDETAAELPQHRRCGGHPIDAAAALALGGDLAAEHQRRGALVPGLFQTVQHCLRHIVKGGPDHGLGRAGAHKVLGGAVAQNGIDGVDEDGFARTRLACQHIQAFFKVNVGFLDDCHIFNLEAAQHSFSCLISGPDDGSAPHRWFWHPAPNGPQ